MGTSYLPLKDSLLDGWALNFQTLIAASPTSYGLVAADATAITAAYTAWHTAYLAAVNPTTRTKATVSAKNEQKANLLGVVRAYAATLRANRAVSDELKIGLGLHVADRVPTPVPAPSTKPVLAIERIEQGFQDIRATDEATPSSRARPQGAAGLLIYRAIGPAAVSDPAQATFLTFVGRPQVQSQFTSADAGKTVTYFARWTNAKGEVGPWSSALSSAIAA